MTKLTPPFPDGGTDQFVFFLKASIVVNPLVVAPTTSVAEAAGLMAEALAPRGQPSDFPDQDSLHQHARASCVVVMDQKQRVLGSFSSIDLVALAATAPSLHAQTMAEVMIQPVLCFSERERPGLVERLRDLRRWGPRYLPVVDDEGALLGILHLDKMLRASQPPATALADRAGSLEATVAGTGPGVGDGEQDGASLPPRALQAHRALVELSSQIRGSIGIHDILERTLHLNAELEDLVKERTLQLQNEEARFQDLFNNTNDLIQSVRLEDAHYEFVNRAWLRLLGYEQAELGALTLYDVIHPDNAPHCRQLIEAMRAGSVLDLAPIELTFLTKDRQEVIVEGSVNCRQEGGVAVASRGIFRDITDRKRSERMLLEREARCRALMEGASDAIFLADTEGHLVEVNRRAEELMGLSKEQLIQMDVSQLHPSEEQERTRAAFSSLADGQSYQLLDTSIQNSSGQIIPVDITCSQLQVGNHVINQALFRDIGERRKSEQIVRQQAQRDGLLREGTQRIRQSLDLQTIFDTACDEIRGMLGADRVGIFQFHDGSGFSDGSFVAESVLPAYPAALKVNIHDHCFGENFASLYSQGRFFASSDIQEDRLEDCHRDILSQFLVRANLVIPLVPGDLLWGLLCIHQCSHAREWLPSDIDLAQQMASQLAIATQQALLYEQVQKELEVRQQTEQRFAQQLRQQEALGMIANRIRETLNLDDILDIVSSKARAILQCERVIVFRLHPDGSSQIISESVDQDLPSLIGMSWEDEIWDQEILDNYLKGDPRIVGDVMSDRWTECLMEYSVAGQIKSKIVAPILADTCSTADSRWNAPNRKRKLWGVLVAHACKSVRSWKPAEAQMLQQIANQLTLAINQSDLFTQLQQELTERQIAQARLTESNSELALTNAELQRATLLKDEFLANMSHELRTPLNVILGMVEGLQDDVFGVINQPQAKALSNVQVSATYLLELINDILDLSKYEAGRLELSCAPTSIAQLCQSSLAFIRQQASEKGIQLSISMEEALPELMIDERRMRQVLINLLSNAVKFTHSGGTVSLEASLLRGAQGASRRSFLDGTLRLSIVDTGIGIAPEDQPKLFQPFVQIDSALSRQCVGTGLGLALVKRIVELHGGHVAMSSALGAGSTFDVDLPLPHLATTSATASINSPESSEGDGLSPPRGSAPLILLAEDNEANITTVSSYLVAKGYRVMIARNGVEAVDMATSAAPDMILMDIQMPVMDGLEAMRNIRATSILASLPIIALTALAMDDDCERCLEAGADRYVSKPVVLRKLVLMIEELLSSESAC